MKKPENIIELKKLIDSMNHRERFVFNVSNDIKSEEIEMLELYHTYIWSGPSGMDKNITIMLTDVSGKLVNKVNKLSRLLRLADEKFLTMIFNYIV